MSHLHSSSRPPTHINTDLDNVSITSSVKSLTPKSKTTKKKSTHGATSTTNKATRSSSMFSEGSVGGASVAKHHGTRSGGHANSKPPLGGSSSHHYVGHDEASVKVKGEGGDGASKTSKKDKDATGSSDLKKSINQLQKEADQQLELEMETQMTLEHFLGQMISLKNAFAMLSDVVMHEVDAARSEARRRIDVSDNRVVQNQQTVDKVIHEFGSLSTRVSRIEEKQDTIIAELAALRSQGDQTATWLTTVSEQVSVVKEQVGETRQAQVKFDANTVKEVNELKRHWDNQSQTIVNRINECSAEVSKQRAELTVTGEQRMDDLELLEKALSTLQAQQVRLRSSVDEAVIPLQTESKSLRSKTDQLDAAISSIKMDAVETRHQMEGIDRDQRLRFDNVSRVMKVFSEAMQVATPPSVNNAFKDV
ncbi:hypothetical protein TrLO_g6998 [Triparma laevis f. longispina]|uniref:Uncharacterized protein n=1 Tax=Triparma laevis f. longispina TaxID=1714387 RepID=A0A9W7FBJ1_9STRA|nr:hypothetical protein TrLO_g6998 [Triparma laevis f. longispina]